jgi:hypothetical protein
MTCRFRRKPTLSSSAPETQKHPQRNAQRVVRFGSEGLLADAGEAVRGKAPRSEAGRRRPARPRMSYGDVVDKVKVSVLL